MTPNELDDLFHQIRHRYETFKWNVYVAEDWYLEFAKHYTYDQALKALRKHVGSSEYKPTCAHIKRLCIEMFGAPNVVSKATRIVEIPERNKRIEYLMDRLGASVVTARIKALVGDYRGPSWMSRLAADRDWIPAYRNLLDELTAEAKGFGPAPEQIEF